MSSAAMKNGTAKNPKHLSKSEEHMTPAYIVEPAREALGGFDLDPATTEEANLLVRAEDICTRADDGLQGTWWGRVFLNPPGGAFTKPQTIENPGKWGYTRSRQALWWLKLMIEYQAARVDSAIFIGFSIEILQVAQQLKCDVPSNFALCVPSERIPFDKWVNGERVSQNQPGHANVIVLVTEDDKIVRRFRQAFLPVGEVFNDCR